MENYQPSTKILTRYAQVLVNYALNSGQGVKPGEVVFCAVPDVAKALGLQLQNTLLKAGAHPIMRLIPTGFTKNFLSIANQDQLTFFPGKYLHAQADLIDHSIGIIADVDPLELASVNPQKIILNRDSQKPYRDWLNEKELKGRFTWTLGLWAMPAQAKLVGLSFKAYWQQIIQACFLDKASPISEWKKVAALQKKILTKLNNLNIQSIHIIGQDVNLKLTIGSNRRWLGGEGFNIPSFEIFTSPDWRGSEGWMKFNQPLYRYGQIIKNIYLEFHHGLVTKASASQGNHFLQEMLKSTNADKLGEFSLTDKRISRITHLMAETLFDENIGGPFGNSHVAIGRAFKECFKGNSKKLISQDWNKLGFNDSAEHTDMISITDRTVTAELAGGQKRVIYKQGQFVI